LEEIRREKDVWDKTEIVGKTIGAVLIPTIVALAVYIWNSERTKQQTASSRVQMAISILEQSSAEVDNRALREWAIAALNSPSDPPPLQGAAAEQLVLKGLVLPTLPDDFMTPCAHPSELFLDGEASINVAAALGDALVLCEARRDAVVQLYLVHPEQRLQAAVCSA